MPSQDKLIKAGIKYTDALFAEISKRLEKGVKASDSLEAFLDKYHKAFPEKGNPLISLGYDKRMLDIILSETNNHRFSRPAQKELVRVTVEEKVGELIVDVGEDIKDSVRDIVRDGYNRNLSQDEIALNISNRVSAIKGKRARAIARTEIARTATVSDYVINRERGANGWYVECRNTACPVCKDRWHKGWTPEIDESFKPSDTSAGGKGWIGDRIFSMNDTGRLPPIHPNSYHKDTQVFTEHGWKYIAELTGDEKLLSLNPDDDSLEFIKPVRLFKHKEPQLVHMHNKWFDVCVTPDHDCFVHKRKDGGKKGRYFEPQFRKPSELNSECHFVRCIDTDRESPEAININGLEFEPSDFAFLMAWYISEGSVLHDVEKAQMRKYPVFIAQQITENREIIQPVLEKMCDYLGLRMNITKNSFVIYSKELYDYLLPLGYSNEKYIPSEVFTLNKECLNIFLDNYVRGDGHERTHGRYNSVERSVFTSSVRLRDDLSYLILLCGYCPSISLHSHKGTIVEHKNGTYTQNYDIYGIRINSSKYATYSGLTVDCVDYDDYTYCVELPKWHTLWVMRNGKTSWNGNCRCVVYYTSEEPNVSKTPSTTLGNDSNESLLEQHVSTKTANNNLLRGEPKIYEDTDEKGEHITVYKFDNIELAFNDNTRITYEELKRHIDSLPKVFEETQATRIYIHDYQDPTYGGLWRSNKKTLYVYDSRKTKEGIFNVFNHEFAHSIDMFWDGEVQPGKYSNSKIYQKIFDEDNKLGYPNLGVIEPDVPIKFVTSYAGRSYLKYVKYGLNEETKWARKKYFTEDFAEASAHYLNPNQHEEFCKEFPNRAKYLETIYGKPDFTNSGIKPVGNLSEEELKLRSRDIEFQPITKSDVVEFYKGSVRLQKDLISKQRDELLEKIESLKEERKRVRRTRRECETEECEEKVKLKVSEMKIQIQRMEKTEYELFEEWSRIFNSLDKLDGLLTS